MTTWPEWMELFTAERILVTSPRFSLSPHWVEVVRAITAAEKRLRPKVDAACRTWARTGSWPRNLSGPVRWFIFWRVSKAVQVAAYLSVPVSTMAAIKVPHVTERELKLWFLIDLWVCGWAELRVELENEPAALRAELSPGRN